MGVGALASRTPLAKVTHFGFHTRSVEVVRQLFKGDVSSEVASQFVRVGKVLHHIDLGVGDHQEVSHLASLSQYSSLALITK